MISIKTIAMMFILFLGFSYAIQTPELFIFTHGSSEYKYEPSYSFNGKMASNAVLLDYGEFHFQHSTYLKCKYRTFSNVMLCGLLTVFLLIFLTFIWFGGIIAFFLGIITQR